MLRNPVLGETMLRKTINVPKLMTMVLLGLLLRHPTKISI